MFSMKEGEREWRDKEGEREEKRKGEREWRDGRESRNTHNYLIYFY